MLKSIKRNLKAFKKYWFKTERYPRFVIPMLFLIFTTTSLITALAIMPALSPNKSVAVKTVFFGEEEEVFTAEQNSEEKTAPAAQGTSVVTEVDNTDTTTAEQNSAPVKTAYRASARPTTAPQSQQPAPAPQSSDQNKINVDQNTASATPTDVVNPIPDNPEPNPEPDTDKDTEPENE